jgi:hypothetical protein
MKRGESPRPLTVFAIQSLIFKDKNMTIEASLSRFSMMANWIRYRELEQDQSKKEDASRY